MATLRKINGKYYAYFYNPHRKPKRKSVPLRVGQKSAAEKLMRRLEEEYAKGTFDPWNPKFIPGSTAFTNAVTSYLEQGRKSWRASSSNTYEFVLRQFERTLPIGMMTGHVDSQHVEDFVIADKSVAQATRLMRFQRLRALFNWLDKNNYIDDNPVRKVKPPRHKKKVPKFLTKDQLQLLLDTMDQQRRRALDRNVRPPSVDWLRDVILIAVTTGLRLGELCALRWEDVDFDSGFLTVRSREGDFEPKSGDERSIPLAGDALDVLERLSKGKKNSKDYVLRSATGRKLNKHVVSQRFKFFCRDAGLPEHIHFHSLRHTTGSWLAQQGVSMPVVQAILGHSSVSVTQQYAHLVPTTLVDPMKRTFKRRVSSGG